MKRLHDFEIKTEHGDDMDQYLSETFKNRGKTVITLTIGPYPVYGFGVPTSCETIKEIGKPPVATWQIRWYEADQ